MRIYSKFKDYYDNVVPFDPSDEIIYVRKEITSEIRDISKLDSDVKAVASKLNMKCYHTNIFPTIGILGFCGKLYCIIENYKEPDDMIREFLNSKEEHYRSSRELREAKDLLESKRVYSDFQQRTDFTFNNAGYKAWKEIVENKVDHTIFLKYKIPMFYITKGKYDNIILFVQNPYIRDIFSRHLDPWTVYQELDMYLGSTLAQQIDPIPERSQNLIRDAHGFDDKSFKSIASGDKKFKRKQNKEMKRIKKLNILPLANEENNHE